MDSWNLGGSQGTNFSAPLLDFFLNDVAHFAGLCQFFFRRALKTGRVRETPVQPPGHTGKNRAAFRACLIANSDHVGKYFAGLEHIKHGLRLITGNINADFLHRLDDDRIEFARFESRAVRFKFVATDLVQKRLGHLAAVAVVNTDKQYSFFHNFVYLLGSGFSAQQFKGDCSLKFKFRGSKWVGVIGTGIHLSGARHAV